MLRRWGFDNESWINLAVWVTPWVLLGLFYGLAAAFLALFTVPSAVLYCFGIGLMLLVTDRVYELKDKL